MTEGSIIALAGVGIAGLSIITQSLITYFNRKADYQRVVSETALKEWQTLLENAPKIAEVNGISVKTYPFMFFLFYYDRLFKLTQKRCITEEDIKELFAYRKSLEGWIIHQGE